MRVYTTFSGSTTGDVTIAGTVSLDWEKRYLFTGYFTHLEGSQYRHLYISTVCSYYGSSVLCGIRDAFGDDGLGFVEVVDHALGVTIKLKSKGGKCRIEGVIYEL